jgi:hypothetical protein
MASPVSVEQLSKLMRWLPLLGLVTAIVLGRIFGIGVGLLIGAGTALMLGIWIFWSSLQNLSGDAPLTLDEALSLGAPTAEEEQKRAVLRALKDLEYERAVGKISDADYAQLSERYRQDAKRLLRLVERDLTPERQRAERLLKERLAELGPLLHERRDELEPGGTPPAEATTGEPRTAAEDEAGEGPPSSRSAPAIDEAPAADEAVAARKAADKRAASTTAEDHE